jgi:polysaccharide export outer membrane protein
MAACAALLSGCNGFSGDEPAFAPNQSASGPAGLATQDRAELAHAADRYTSGATPGSGGYRVGPQDVLEITVFKAPDLSKTVQVAESGTINLPLIGDVVAAGRTASDIERDLQTRLGAQYLKSPQVTVFVKEYNSQRITVEGAVRKPGVYPIRGHDTLLRAIAMAEGLDKDTASANVVVFRATGEGRAAIRYDLSAIRSGGAADPLMQAGDVVVVDDSMAKTVFQTFIKLLPLATPVFYLL